MRKKNKEDNDKANNTLNDNKKHTITRKAGWISKFMILTLLVSLGLSLPVLAKKAKLDPDSKRFYTLARHFFTKNERKIFLGLPNMDLRKRFIQYFWEIRDPNPFTEENEFKFEIEQRFDFVSKYLKEGPIPGWKTDRGRMYMLLGAPYDQVENHFDGGSVIYWYFEETDIHTRFWDRTGQRIFHMDLNYTSLKLLDVMERKKHHISTNENSNFYVGMLKFDMTYIAESNELIFKIKTKEVNFDKDKSGDKMTAKFKIDLMVYGGKELFTKSSHMKSVSALPEDLLKDKAYVEVRVPVKLPKGKAKIDAIVTDYLGNATHRKLLKVKGK